LPLGSAEWVGTSQKVRVLFINCAAVWTTMILSGVVTVNYGARREPLDGIFDQLLVTFGCLLVEEFVINGPGD
jgi:hypothetical protein